MLKKLFTKSTATATVALMTAGLLASCTAPSQETSSADSASPAAEGAACAAEIPEIEFGIISTESQENLKPLWEPFLDAMEAEIGRPVTGFYATDYAGVIEAMGAGKLQIAWYGGKAYIEAAERSNAEVFAQTVNADGTQGYYSHLITNVDNPILQNIDVEKGDGDQYVIQNAADLTFAFNDPESTSGFLVPTYYVFAKNGVNPNEAFEELLFSGSHEATAQAVANNQVDVATNNSESLLRLEESDPAAREKVQIIWTSPIIPSDPIAYRNDLPDCLKEEIRTFFYSYTDAAVLEPLGWSKFVEAEDSQWNTIRELEIAKDILEVQNDANLSEADKQTQLDELNQKLEALQ
ncbi:phosphonate ABC transporter substrate-binding protein [Oscillatoria sp. FACHB-1407]|uniref:phosphonate ABC transporter substrate-binding protein n=1 Tax=Oscillatoria sp. FACHB-1407 TaxID=2692847 RepID=UPI001689FC42|nr:phosphonate ABC transporter substrate-binding protein [Oscillatoria sp. FACHB-1407]MBD2464154.1 phosphonate ABC transporter substrate-binding protein [Oscillatoria sp. FACHB-1407]